MERLEGILGQQVACSLAVDVSLLLKQLSANGIGNINDISMHVKDLLSSRDELVQFGPFTEASALTFILENDIGTDCIFSAQFIGVRDVEAPRFNGWIHAHRAILSASPGYFRDRFSRDHFPDKVVLGLPAGVYEKASSGRSKAIYWLIRYLYQPDTASAPRDPAIVVENIGEETLPCCVEALKLGKVFGIPELQQYALNAARNHVDKMLHVRFKAIAGIDGPLRYLEKEAPLELAAMGALPAVIMLAELDTTVFLEDEHAKQLLQDIVLLVIGINHRISEEKGEIQERFTSELYRLSCANEAFYKLHMGMNTSLFRLGSILSPKKNTTAQECACPSHPTTQNRKSGQHKFIGFKRRDIWKTKDNSGSQPYILPNPFDGGRTMYCWNCAGTHGYPWRHPSASEGATAATEVADTEMMDADVADPEMGPEMDPEQDNA